MRALKGEIPRAYHDHRSTVAREYRACFEALRAEYPGGPSRWLREAAILLVDLRAIGEEITALRLRRQRTAASRLQRRQLALRNQLAKAEDRLERLSAAAQPASSFAEVVARVADERRRREDGAAS